MRSDLDINAFRQRLEHRLADIEAERKTIGPVDLDQSRVGRLSRMDAMQQQAMAQAAKRLTDQEEQRIRTALSRIATGDYGYCVQCDEDIAAGRLNADPSALTCIACARALDDR
jgi:DnaK suppressor protein